MLTLTEIMTISECYPDREHFARAIESAVMAKLREQKPFAWACWLNNDTEQKPIDCRISTLEPTAYPIRRKLFIHPAPIPEGYTLVPIEPTAEMGKEAKNE